MHQNFSYFNRHLNNIGMQTLKYPYNLIGI